MDIDRFKDSPIGDLVPITVPQLGRAIDHFAFLPHRLPTEIDLRSETMVAIERAISEVSLLEGSARNLEDPYLITMPVIRHEAQSTSAIEGTISDLDDLWDVEDDAGDNVQEVLNYVDAAERGIELIKQRPLAKNLLNELHRILMQGSQHASTSGRVRTGQVAIGGPGQLVTEARFVPPPAQNVAKLYDDWERWVNETETIPLVARIAMAHYQFETIHPYHDGNGRIGRLAAILMLVDKGPLTDHLLALSPYFETRRSRYIDLLAETSATGDFDPWIKFFAEALEAEARNACRRIVELLSYRDHVVEVVRENNLRGHTVMRIAEDLITHPIMSPNTVSKRYDISFQTANRAISQLVDLGILVETTGGSYGRKFRNDEVFRIIRAAHFPPSTATTAETS